MAVTSRGTDTCCSAHGVELLLEHQSMSSIESLARIALALRNDRSVSRRVPVAKAALAASVPRPGSLTLSTICVEIVPSFFSSLRGARVAW